MAFTSHAQQADVMRGSIVQTFMILAMAHTDALVILTETPMLVPTLVVFLTNLTMPLWEEDDIVSSPAQMTT